MKLATWNINSIRARKERLLAWLQQASPDVLCLQETKTEDEHFPADELRACGYHAVTHGQKSYNGVAILSKEPPRDVSRGLGDGGVDSEARIIAATCGGVRVVSVYVPNGKEVGCDRYEHKLDWMQRLRAYLDRLHRPDEPVAVAGDFNVAPDDRDVYDPAGLAGQLLCSAREREALAGVVGWGLVDTFRLHHEAPGLYSWWDYRMLAFPKNRGLRIDMIYVSQVLASRCTASAIDRQARKGKGASDHAPVLAEIEHDAGSS